MTAWLEKITEYGCEALFVDAQYNEDGHPLSSNEWMPTDKDRSAAWALYTQMRTRITTQPLAFRHGDEETALDSVFQIFGMTRSAISEHEGCTHFATLAVHVLNVHIRPFTAYWHKVRVAGQFNSSDTSHRFRRELMATQDKLRLFMRLLGYLAEGDGFVPVLASGIESSTVYADYDLGDPIRFGVTDSLVPLNDAKEIDDKEQAEVVARRKLYELPSEATGCNDR